MKLIAFFSALSVSLSLFTPKAHGLVAVANGNYFVGFTDVSNVGKVKNFQLKMNRTYNSRSQYVGKFGYGWGTEFESFLLASADGSVVIQESGGGEKTRFTPKKFNRISLEAHVNKLIRARSAKGERFNSKSYKLRLMRDVNYRDEEGRKYGVVPTLPVGTKLYSSQRGEVVTVLKNGFLRSFKDGKRVYFTAKSKVKDVGRMLRGVYKVGKFKSKDVTLYFTYSEGNKFLKMISDRRGQSLNFKENSKGQVIEVWNHLGEKAYYTFCPSERYNVQLRCGPRDLIASVDSAGNKFTYAYDNLHNLRELTDWGKKGKGGKKERVEKISYWPSNLSKRGGVKQVKNYKRVKVGKTESLRLLVTIDYDYWVDTKNPHLHFKTTTETTYLSGRKAKASYEFWNKRKPDGSIDKYKIVSNVGGERTETIYDNGQPIQVDNSRGKTSYIYYKSGLPHIKDSPEEKITWVYDKKFYGKISKISVLKKRSGKVLETVFSRNKKGRVLQGRTSDGRGVVISYDSKDRVKYMVDHLKHKFRFIYEGNSLKPRRIELENVGALVVSYDDQGTVIEVKPVSLRGRGLANLQKGRKIALRIAEVFQDLTEIIKPIGIRLI